MVRDEVEVDTRQRMAKSRRDSPTGCDLPSLPSVLLVEIVSEYVSELDTAENQRSPPLATMWH